MHCLTILGLHLGSLVLFTLLLKGPDLQLKLGIVVHQIHRFLQIALAVSS